MTRTLSRTIPHLGITIKEAKLNKLGHWDPKRKEIVLSTKQKSWVGKNITLLHEIIHATDDAMIGAGIRKKRISHNWIENASMNLLLFFVLAGLWRGISKKQIVRFYKGRR